MIFLILATAAVLLFLLFFQFAKESSIYLALFSSGGWPRNETEASNTIEDDTVEGS